ncbi:SpoIIE family protein phosphatase [Desulfobacter latus]|uniref:SpoIIE family protein phosphatase n=1 Tax=Desulfobacter latus TaxID=2292 RepID=A0A850T7S9_9BACT|nr:SpoIIE family protein phosphatase [Desulfobacter latus]NWH05155.1 SpoIIE family protein phosphatase [Desulfobacter latus]
MAEVKKTSTQTFIISHEFDVLRARKYGAEISEKMGFREISQAEIDIVISELGTNIVKHSRAGGILVFRSITMGPIENGRLEIAAQNNDKTLGKGFEQVKENLEKNQSTTATLGIGLSGIRRMTDSFDLRLTQENKLEFIVSKLVDADLQSPVKVSVISRPILGERVSGDTYYSRQSRNEILFGVVDGLGHGPEAHKVAELSERIIDIHYLKPLGLIIEQLHRHLRQTRGAAVSLASIDFLQNQLSHISLGNIETRLYKRGKCEKLMTYNGTVGALIPRFKVMTYPFAKGDCVIMTSDGISDKYEVDSKTLLSVPQKVTHVIMSEFGRNHDDATVLVVK